MRKKHILFLCSWYPCRTSPHNGNFIERHIECLDDAVDKRVLAVVEDANLTNSYFEFVHGINREVPHLIVYFKKTKIPFFKFFIKFLAYLRGYFKLKRKAGKFDLIHVHVLIDAGFIAFFIQLFSKTPYIITEHSSLYLNNNLDRFPKFVKPLIRLAANRSQLILPVSNYLKNNIQRLNISTPFEVVPNIVNTTLFKPKGMSVKKPVKFLHISAFQESKNIAGMLRAVKRLSEKRMDFTMTIAGDGDLSSVVQLAEEMNIPSEILHFQGKMADVEVATLMQAHHSFVLFSNFETFGVVLIEALATGLPIISTQIPSIQEIVHSEELGKLVPIGDEIALEAALDFMIDNISNYDTNTLRRRAVDSYSNAIVKQQILAVYERLTSV